MRAVILTLAVLAASPAQAWLSRSGEHVEARGDGRFEVLASPGLGPAETWCAAGDYALRRLALPPATKIWRITPPPNRQDEGVIFSTSSEGASAKSGLLQLGENDGALSVAHAAAKCHGVMAPWRD